MRVRMLVVAALTALAASGCAVTPTHSAPSPTPSATPVFASDEEALAAAEKAYAAYLSVSDRVTSREVEVEALEPYVTAKQLKAERADLAPLTAQGGRTTGHTTFDRARLQQVSASTSGAKVLMYVCIDVADVRILDSSARDVTPADRRSRVPLEISLVSAGATSAPLLLDRSETWPGPDFCSP